MTAIIKANKKAFAKLQKAADKLAKDARPQINAAINDATKQLRTEASARIREHLAAKKKDIDNKLRRKISRVKKLSGVLYISEKSLGLGKFRNSQVKMGVRAKINKQGSMTTFPGAFGPKTKLKPYVYKRMGAERYPIITMPALNFAEEVKRYGVEKLIRSRVKDVLKHHASRRIRLLQLRATGKVPEARRGA